MIVEVALPDDLMRQTGEASEPLNKIVDFVISTTEWRVSYSNFRANSRRFRFTRAG